MHNVVLPFQTFHFPVLGGGSGVVGTGVGVVVGATVVLVGVGVVIGLLMVVVSVTDREVVALVEIVGGFVGGVITFGSSVESLVVCSPPFEGKFGCGSTFGSAGACASWPAGSGCIIGVV